VETPLITTELTSFEIGKAQLLTEGKELTIIATGPITYQALIAARNLQASQKIEVEVIACPTIKPLDEQTILRSAKKTGNVVTIEEHQIAGGLGSAVSELLSETHPTKILRIGIKDTFGESGSYEQVLNKYRLNAEGITEQIINFFGEKQWIY
jgi:transketolase